jgi:hypothetical protein
MKKKARGNAGKRLKAKDLSVAPGKSPRGGSIGAIIGPCFRAPRGGTINPCFKAPRVGGR